MVLVQDSWPSFTPPELEEFEERIGCRLPEDYREFLCKHNGGSFPDRVKLGEGSVDLLYGLNTGFSWGDLEWHHEMLTRSRGDLPAEFLPIGSDPGGNSYCLAIHGPDRGEIWFWDHEYFSDPEEALSFKAHDFAAFMEGLRTEVDPPASKHPAFQAIERGALDQLVELLDNGLSVETRHRQKWGHKMTLLMCAIHDGRLNIIAELLQRGADMYATDARDFPVPFYTCLGKSSSDAMRLLLQAGLSVNFQDAQGQSLLMFSVSTQSARVFRVLLKAGASLHLEDLEGRTVFDYCDQDEEDEYYRLLMDQKD